MNFKLSGSFVKNAALIGGTGAVLIAAPFIGKHEGRRYEAYKDVGGVLTVCDGHTGSDIIADKVYTDEECDDIFVRDIVKAERYVDMYIQPAEPLPSKTKAAFISFTYNVGPANLKASTLRRKANAGDLQGACRELSRWVYVKRVKIKGLVNRRISERALCMEGIATDV